MSQKFKIVTAKDKYSKYLDRKETIIWADGSCTLLTDARLVSFKPLAFGGFRRDSRIEILLSLPIELIDIEEGFTVADGALEISLRDGQSTSIKSAMNSDELEELARCVIKAAANPQIIGYLQTITPGLRAQIREKQTREIKEHKKAEQDTSEVKCGRVLARGAFASHVVTIYAKGYVRVDSGMGIAKGNAEKLQNIFGETDITRKTGLGRAAGAVLTNGLNLLSPGQRGNVYLTISTDRETHSLMTTNPTNDSIKVMNELVSAGKSVLSSLASKSGVVSEVEGAVEKSPDLVAQLSNLAGLRDSGVLTQQEFEKAKAKLLG
jgi:hypothetical protein